MPDEPEGEDGMFLFCVKKAFFDFWDHFIPAILANLGFIVVLAIPTLAPSWLREVSPIAGLITFVAGVLLLFVYLGCIAMVAGNVVLYRSPQWEDLPRYLRQTWRPSVVLGGIFLLHALLLSVALPVYTSMDTLIASAAVALLFWGSVLWLMASLYYFPLRAQLGDGVPKLLKKCFILLFDNGAFTLGVALATLATVAISLFTALLLPGPMGVLIWLNTAFKLRLYKYDYLEEHPNAHRRRLPWDELLAEDRERVGKRTLKGMLFPWRE